MWCLYFEGESEFQFLEKENARLEFRMKELLKDLEMQKDQCDLMRDKATQLEVDLKNTKVHFLSYFRSSLSNYFEYTVNLTTSLFRLIFI